MLQALLDHTVPGFGADIPASATLFKVAGCDEASWEGLAPEDYHLLLQGMLRARTYNKVRTSNKIDVSSENIRRCLT